MICKTFIGQPHPAAYDKRGGSLVHKPLATRFAQALSKLRMRFPSRTQLETDWPVGCQFVLELFHKPKLHGIHPYRHEFVTNGVRESLPKLATNLSKTACGALWHYGASRVRSTSRFCGVASLSTSLRCPVSFSPFEPRSLLLADAITVACCRPTRC